MLAKVLVLAFVAAASCQDHGYTLKRVTKHEVPKEYRQPYPQEPAPVEEVQYNHVPVEVQYKHVPDEEVQYKHVPVEEVRYKHVPVEEVQYNHAPVQKVQYKHVPAEEVQYKPVPESYKGHAYSSQSIIHHAAVSSQESSQDSTSERVAPLYQYVQEEEEPSHRPTPATHYQTIRYPAPVQHEVQSVHYSTPAYEIQDAHKAHVQYAHAHEDQSYHTAHHEGPIHHQEAHIHHQEAPIHHQEASIHHQEAPIHHETFDHDSHDELIDYYAYPKYQYEYKVEDPHTGDNKFHHEIRDGDVVKGVYSLHEADGSVRIVEYSADKHHGFSAVVKHSAPGQHVQIETHHPN